MIYLQGDFGTALGGMWPILLMFVVIYFFMIRPQTKKTKEQNNFLADLAKGDEVVTASGILGRITKIEGNIVQIQVDNKTFLRVLKSAVSKEMSEAMNQVDEEK